jgi:NTE family protein
VDQAFLLHLHSLGRKQADAWLGRNFDDLGIRSTVDIRATYL